MRNSYQCSFCDKTYKKIKSLRKYIQSVHKNSRNTNQEDCLQNYTKNALALCYIAKNVQDARKHGGGDRIIRLYKFLLIYFKIDGRTQYAYQSLHLLAQISFFLPPSLAFELKWNRFVNTKGTIDGNVELDRHLQHLNKYVKADLAQFQVKMTENSIARCSRSYFKMQKITDHFDKQLGLVSPSGRHSVLHGKKM